MTFRGDKLSYEGQFSHYIPDLLQRAPIEEMYEEVPTLEREMVDPARARQHLERLGISEEQWSELLEISGDVNDTRAYILAAMGTQKRMIHVLNANLITLDALCDQDGTNIGVGPTLRQPDMQTPAIVRCLGEIASAN